MVLDPSALIRSFAASILQVRDHLPVTGATRFLQNSGITPDTLSQLYTIALRNGSPISDDIKGLYVHAPELDSASSCTEALDRILAGLHHIGTATSLPDSPLRIPRQSAPKKNIPAPSRLVSEKGQSHPQRISGLRVFDLLNQANIAKDKIDASMIDAVEALRELPLEDQAVFWRTLLGQPNALWMIRKLSFHLHGGVKRPSVDAVYQAITENLFRFVAKLWNGGPRRSTSPIILHNALPKLAKLYSYDNISANFAALAKDPGKHGQMLAAQLTNDRMSPALTQTLLDCLAAFDPDHPDVFFIQAGLQADLSRIRETFLFVAQSAHQDPKTNWPLLATFWSEIMAYFLGAKKEESSDDLFYKLVNVIAISP